MAIELVTQFSSYVDEQFSTESKKSMLTNQDFGWDGAHSVKIYKATTAKMNDYDRAGTGANASRYPGVPGRFYEVIMPDAFKTSLLQTTCIQLKVDHTRVIGSTHSGELQLADDSRGLWAHALISDPAVIAAARSGCIRGWSFAFIAEQSEWYRLDPREKLYYRKVKRAKLLEVSLMIEKDAAYSGTTVNVKNVEEEKPWSFMKLKEILRP